MTDYYCNWCIVAILRFLAQSTSRHVVMSAMIYHQKMAPLFGEALCTYLYYGYHHILCSTLKVCKKKMSNFRKWHKFEFPQWYLNEQWMQICDETEKNNFRKKTLIINNIHHIIHIMHYYHF